MSTWPCQKWDLNLHLNLESSYIYLTLYGGVRSGNRIHTSIWSVMSTWPYMVTSEVEIESTPPFSCYVHQTLYGYVRSRIHINTSISCVLSLLTLYGGAKVGFEPSPPFGVFLCLVDLIWCVRSGIWTQTAIWSVLMSIWPYMVVIWWCQKWDSNLHQYMECSYTWP